jgi:hypothetical protein
VVYIYFAGRFGVMSGVRVAAARRGFVSNFSFSLEFINTKRAPGGKSPHSTDLTKTQL